MPDFEGVTFSVHLFYSFLHRMQVHAILSCPFFEDVSPYASRDVLLSKLILGEAKQYLRAKMIWVAQVNVETERTLGL